MKIMQQDQEASKAQIRAAGLKWTSSRAAVLRVLQRAAAPLTHADVVEEVEKEGFEPSTVYRNLVDLFDAGVLKRFDVGDHTWRYEVANHDDTHPHFWCESCGVIECLPDASVQLQKSPKRGLGARRIATVLLKGACAACA
jgi:Fur family transcriptional regulator, ferric uptake regulator